MIHLISYTNSELPSIHEVTHCFSPIKIYVPWGGTIPAYADNKEIFALYPPEELKPDADFNMFLDECFAWAYEQSEKSRKEIIKTGHINPTSSESLRHIKTILSNRISDTSEKDMILRWHMLLHLANRLEENRNDANRLIENLKKKPSPLLNNADLTESTQYPLENLREIGPEFFITDANIKLLLRAWHGLFNNLVDKGDMLLTVDRRIFEHVSMEWNSYNNNEDLRPPEIISFKGTPFKRSGIKSAEVTIGNDIQDVVLSDTKEEDKIIELKNLTSEFESFFQTETEDSQILFSLMLFHPAEKFREFDIDPFLKFLSGRALLLAEIDA